MNMPMRNSRSWIAGFVVPILMLGEAIAADLSHQNRADTHKPAALSTDYLRVLRPNSNTVCLEVAARKFVPSNHQGPIVWLTGASHIGESNYFRALQRHLDAQDLVLYEGVKRWPEDTAAGSLQEVDERSLQLAVAESLGLAFQLKAIDYRRPHFRNSDLSIPELQRCLSQNLVDARDSKGAGELKALLTLMDGSSFLSKVVQFGVRLIGSTPKLQALAKLALIETLGELRGDLSQAPGLPPEISQLVHVILQSRNDAVAKDLATALKQRPPVRSLAIFYGAAHMPDLQKRLCDQFAYRVAGEVWHTAISVEPGKSGVNEEEANLIRKLVRAQMDELNSPSD
ncbi:MAG TPA: hypothetical protein P5186_17475 [Candidatus Paceibacterota bacterium]|nr:hypothetical protein [Verrucomicrobiota bacterium]HRY49842.1 hypothetical protein [Candidatus Paceibacterota bacterium]